MGGKIVRTIGIARARFKIGNDESRLQHPPAGSARAGGGRARLSALTGGVRAASCNRIARSPSKPQDGPDRGTHPGASAATTRPAKAKIPEIGYFSRFPVSCRALVALEDVSPQTGSRR